MEPKFWLDLIWLIPLLPILGVVLNGLFGRRMPRAWVGGLACAVVFAALVLAVGAVWELSQIPPGQERFHSTTVGTWIPLGGFSHGSGETYTIVKNFEVDWGFALDPLSALLLLVVTGVGFLIHVYSVGYMSHEKDFARFFVYLNLFMAMMCTLVLADNLLVLFVGWEGVGLCSYLLIGFFWDRPFDERSGMSCADAGRKAFIVNRIGDFAFLVGLLYLAVTYGTLNMHKLSAAFGQSQGSLMLSAVALLLFLGACGKSAQIPLYVWLPDAMAGPTPVSALIHAATMVTAGVYMVCRMSALYDISPVAMAIVAAVGATTALFAATMGLAATDIKKVLAYSTVSQLGYMFAAAGVGAYGAAMFHLMTHAFFKALLFLGAGSVIHGLHGEQDIRKMGNVRAKMPVTFWTFVVATLAICGIAPFAGFFSKDEILWGAWSSDNKLIWGILAAAAVITAFYMTRLVWLVFLGSYRGEAAVWNKAHESPRSMTVPLMLLALLSLGGGLIGVPAVLGGGNHLHHWLEPAVGPHHAVAAHGVAEVTSHAAEELALIATALLIAIGGILFAASIYRRAGAGEVWSRRLGPLYVLVRNLYWVDELYELVLLRPFYAVSRYFRGFDRWVVDGLVNATGITAELTGQVIKLFQTGLVRNYALMFLLGVVAILFYFMTI